MMLTVSRKKPRGHEGLNDKRRRRGYGQIQNRRYTHEMVRSPKRVFSLSDISEIEGEEGTVRLVGERIPLLKKITDQLPPTRINRYEEIRPVIQLMRLTGEMRKKAGVEGDREAYLLFATVDVLVEIYSIYRKCSVGSVKGANLPSSGKRHPIISPGDVLTITIPEHGSHTLTIIKI